jgi:hypothetical protein
MGRKPSVLLRENESEIQDACVSGKSYVNNLLTLLPSHHREMAAPALLFLESLGPLSFLGSQVVHGLKPFMDVVIDPADAERLATLLERRESIERLSSLIQEQANISA